jgi:hypothetical protein
MNEYPKSFSVYDVICAQIYGGKNIKQGVHSRYAEIAGAKYLLHLNFSNVIDCNLEAISSGSTSCPFVDLVAEMKGRKFLFDVKSKQNPLGKDLWHDLSKLRENESILFCRTYGEIHDVKVSPVGYMLYPYLKDLFKINEKYEMRIPPYFFFNNDPAEFIEYALKNDPFEVPFMLETLEKLMRSGKIPAYTQQEMQKIISYINVSQNRDAFELYLQYQKQHKVKKAA